MCKHRGLDDLRRVPGAGDVEAVAEAPVLGDPPAVVVHLFLPPKAQNISKKRKKKRQPKKFKNFIAFFKDFFIFRIFCLIFKYYYIEIPEIQKAPFFSVFCASRNLQITWRKEGEGAKSATFA